VKGGTRLALFLNCLLVPACERAPDPVTDEVYIVVPFEKGSSFRIDLASLVKKYGMNPNLVQAIDEKGHPLYVLDAVSSSVRLLSQNTVLSGQEDPNLCGNYAEPHTDHGQYFISVSPYTQEARHEAHELLAKIVKDLKADGYDVRSESLICSPQSKKESKGGRVS